MSLLLVHPDPNLVVVMLGGHQPHTYVTGLGVGHDVPTSIITPDPSVLQRVGSWDWQAGLHPSPTAPVWRMDKFRDRFLAAYGPG